MLTLASRRTIWRKQEQKKVCRSIRASKFFGEPTPVSAFSPPRATSLPPEEPRVAHPHRVAPAASRFFSSPQGRRAWLSRSQDFNDRRAPSPLRPFAAAAGSQTAGRGTQRAVTPFRCESRTQERSTSPVPSVRLVPKGLASLCSHVVEGRALTAFMEALDNRRRAELPASPGWETLVEAAMEAGGIAFAPWIPRETFAADLAARLNAASTPIPDWFARLHVPDLYLACACARGVAPAIEQFQRLYAAEILRSAARFNRASQTADDLHQLLCQRLFVGHDGRPPKIAEFGGQGQLRSWLHVTMVRMFLDATRSVGNRVEVPLEDALETLLPAVSPDPELELLKKRASVEFKAAFAEAVRGLEPSFRHVLRLSVIEKLTIDQLAAIQGVHRATAARRIVNARDALLAGTRASMSKSLRLHPDELDSLLGLIASRLEASVERLLREP